MKFIGATMILFCLLLFGSFVFADNFAFVENGSTKTVLSVSSSIFVPTYCDSTATARTSTLSVAATDPIVRAMNINQDFLVTLASLNIKLNFQHLFVYVNVNKTNVMSFMGNGNINSNGEIYRSSYYQNNVYFLILSSLKKSDQGYYTFNLNVEALNSQVGQWINSTQYAIPIEFTVLEQQNINYMIANLGNKIYNF